MGEGVTAYIVAAAALVLCGIFAWRSRAYVARAFDSIDGVLDKILSKDAAALAGPSGEDRLSKLTHKARRVAEMRDAEVEGVRAEKETIQAFISDMSHQMKTPLSGVSMYAELLAEPGLSESERGEFVSRVSAGAEKLRWILDGLIKIARLEAGAFRVNPSPTNIRRTVAGSIEAVAAPAAKKGVTVSAEGLEDATILHDARWTGEALANVLENAVKYSYEGGSIEITADRLPLYYKLVVTDHGVGFEKDDLNLIFKRFHRGGNAGDREGAGLGLYLAALIMERQGGYIVAESVPGEHTSFSLYFRADAD